MGLLASGTSTKTTVKPDARVEALLKKIAQQSKEVNDKQSFVNHDMANMSDDYRGALSQYANSPELQQGYKDLSGQTGVGLDQLNSSNQGYQSIIDNPVTAQNAQDFRGSLTGKNSLSNASLAQGTNAAGAIKTLGGSAALRSAGRLNTGNINATMNNSRGQQLQGMGISNQLGNQNYTSNVANMQGGLAGNNLSLGAQGVQMGQQAIQNQLSAGNALQQYQQAQNQNDWQNQIGASQFDWGKINNQLNVLNGLSPMAGYTATNTTAAPSASGQLFGAGLSALGTYGNLGGFAGSDALSSGKVGGTGADAPVYKNQWSNSGGTGIFNGWFGGSK